MDACNTIFKFIRTLSLYIKESNKKQNETIKNLNDNAAKGLADCTINCPLIKAELQKNTKR